MGQQYQFLESFRIDDAVTLEASLNGTIPANLFNNVIFEKLATVYLGTNVKAIGDNAFKNVKLVTSFAAPGVETLGLNAITNPKLEVLELPALTALGAGQISGGNIKTLKLPAVAALHGSAFTGISGLADLYLGAQIPTITDLPEDQKVMVLPNLTQQAQYQAMG